jgi:hypothetical protein
MASDFDQSDFVDSDFHTAHDSPFASPPASPPAAPGVDRGPTRAELDARVSEAQQRLAELKRAQEALERERAGLEEARRRQIEFQTGREEMRQGLTRGLGLLEESEFAARRDAEQMAKTIAALHEALNKVQAIREETWTKDEWNVELTRALTVIENARMEWNAARLRWPLLSAPEGRAETGQTGAPPAPLLGTELPSFGRLCKWGLAMTWPLVLLAAIIAVLFALLLLRR